jgi:hypothetical protein
LNRSNVRRQGSMFRGLARNLNRRIQAANVFIE